MEIRHIRSLEEFESLHNEWDKLLKDYQHKTVFLSWEWLTAWWKNNKENKELWLLIAYENGIIFGIAPLMLTNYRRYGISIKVLQSLGYPNTDHSDFIAHNNNPEIIQMLCDHIVSQKGSNFQAIKLEELPEDSAALQIFHEAIKKIGGLVEVKTNSHYFIPTTANWEKFNKALSKNTRKNIKKRLRHAREIFDVSMTHLQGKEVTDEHLTKMFEINENGHFPDKYKSDSEKAFLKDLIARSQDKGFIEIFFINFNTNSVAFELGFNSQGVFEDWRTGYDKNFEKFAPGTLLIVNILIKMCEQENYTKLDFLRGEHEFKQQWNSEVNYFKNLTATLPNHPFTSIFLIYAPKVKEWIKKHVLHRPPD